MAGAAKDIKFYLKKWPHMLSFAKRDVFEGSCENLTDFMVEPVCAKHLTKKLFVCESCRDQGVGSPDP